MKLENRLKRVEKQLRDQHQDSTTITVVFLDEQIHIKNKEISYKTAGTEDINVHFSIPRPKYQSHEV